MSIWHLIRDRLGMRGNDGLTRSEREALAAEWRAGAGRKPTVAEVRDWERQAARHLGRDQ